MSEYIGPRARHPPGAGSLGSTQLTIRALQCPGLALIAFVCMCTCMHVCIHKLMYVVYMCVSAWAHVCMVYIYGMSTHMCKSLCVCGVYVWECMCLLVWCLCVCEYICEHEFFCVCMMCACAWVHVCVLYMWASTCVCMYLCLWIHVCVHVSTLASLSLLTSWRAKCGPM